MPTYTVPIPGGGEYHVNASSQAAAYQNVGVAAPSGGGGGGGGGGGNPAAIGQNQYGDDIFNTPNGQKTGTQITQELAAAGWDGQGDPVQVYNRTAAGGGGGGGGAQTPPGMPGAAPGGGAGAGGVSLDPQSLAALTSFGNAAGTATAADLAERKRQFDATLAQQQRMWEQQGLPQLVIQQKSLELQQQEFAFQMQQAQKNLALQQNQLAATVIGQAAQLGGPQNFVQAANYARGIRQTDIPSFMTSLLTGQPTSGTAGSAGLGTPETLSSLAQKMGASGSLPTLTDQPDLGTTLNLGKAIFAAGGGALSPQSMEGLSSTEQQMLGSVGNAVGGDLPTFMSQYARTRIGQQATQAA